MKKLHCGLKELVNFIQVQYSDWSNAECPPELFSVLIRGLKEHSSWNSNLIPIRAVCLRSATAGGLLLKFCNGMNPVSGFWWRGLTKIPFTGRILRMNYRKWPWKKCIGCVMVFHLLRRELLKKDIQRLLYKERICQFAKSTKYLWISVYIPTQ